VPHRPLQVPRYQRVYGVIHQRIRLGEYPAGSALSTEDKLAAEFGVSKATVRQAVGELVDRGLVVRQQGRGTFVCEDAVTQPPHPFVGSLADLIIGTHKLSIGAQSVERAAVFPSAVRTGLQMTVPAGTMLRHRGDIDGTPFAYVIAFLSPIVNDYLKPSELKVTGRVTLLKERGMDVTGARQSMSAELADTEVARQLDIDIGAPVLFAERLVTSTQGPVEVVHTWYRGDLYKWEAEMLYTWTLDGLSISVTNEMGTPARN
jgi:GntR family transcriptional regulator